jgi:hypothetical protein
VESTRAGTDVVELGVPYTNVKFGVGVGVGSKADSRSSRSNAKRERRVNCERHYRRSGLQGSLSPHEGCFILQVTLVQEGVRWFEDERPEIVQEAEILVKR